MGSDGPQLRHAALPTPLLIMAFSIGGPDEKSAAGRSKKRTHYVRSVKNVKSDNILHIPDSNKHVVHTRNLIVAALSALCIVFSGYWHKAEVQMLRVSYAQWSGA